MKNRYLLWRRNRGIYYSLDNLTGKRESLHTKDHKQAAALIHTKNEAHQHPAFSLQKARIYLMESDPSTATRTWADVMKETTGTKTGETQTRYTRAFLAEAFNDIRNLVLIETKATSHALIHFGDEAAEVLKSLASCPNVQLENTPLPVPGRSSLFPPSRELFP